MKRILKSELDKFYTKEDLAIRLISILDLSKYDLVVDPCCGDGVFYTNTNHNNKIAIDILPHIDNVIKHDFLTWNHSVITEPRDKVLVLSNPPFGKQGSLAFKFINRCAEFSDTIAFILPLSFVKQSMMNRIPNYYHLDYQEILEPDSYLLDGENFDVKCVFQIWQRKSFPRRKVYAVNELGFKFTKDKSKADLSIRRVGIYAGRTFKDTDRSEQSHYFIILEDKNKIDLVYDKLNSKKWDDFTVGPRSISKSELNPYINLIIALI